MTKPKTLEQLRTEKERACAALSSAGSKKIVRPEGESGGRFFVGDSGHAQAKCVVSHRCREWGKRREVR